MNQPEKDQRARDAFWRRGDAAWVAVIISRLQELARRRATLEEVASAMRFFAPLWPTIMDDIGDPAAFLSLVQKALKGTLRNKPYDDVLFAAFDDAYKANGWPTPKQFCEAVARRCKRHNCPRPTPLGAVRRMRQLGYDLENRYTITVHDDEKSGYREITVSKSAGDGASAAGRGKVARGKLKKFSPKEIQRRKERLAKARSKRWPKK